MNVAPLLDRLVFWNIPGWMKADDSAVPYRALTHDGLEIWHLPGRPDGPTVLFCHGNSGHLRFPRARMERLIALNQTGANLWAFDYRGYGKSVSCVPTEARVYQDATTVYALAQEHHSPENDFVIYGRSLGGAVATHLALELGQPDKLILESTFTSAPDVCARYAGRKIAERMNYRFDNRSRVSKLSCPIYMVHGTYDLVVPYRMGRELWRTLSDGREFLTVPRAGHNNLQQIGGDLYLDALHRWLSP